MMLAMNMPHNYLLSNLLEGLVTVPKNQDQYISGISCDSRTVGDNYLFIACDCKFNTGIEFINHAISNGASAVLYESGKYKEPLQSSVTYVDIENLHKKTGIISSRFFGDPSKGMNIIGVTGTNGKSTVSHILAQTLDECGLIGTLGYGTVDRLLKTNNTTPAPVELQSILSDFRDTGIKNVVLEVSSHGLDQYRIVGTAINTAVFTNISRDHLDYHVDLQTYADVKRKLFTDYNIFNAVINAGDAQGREFIKHVRGDVRIIQYCLNPMVDDFSGRYEHVNGFLTEPGSVGSPMQIKSSWGESILNLPVAGEFNASNLLACIGVLCINGIPFNDALDRLSRIKPVPGRLETFTGNNTAQVFVDYAHTPDALREVLRTLKKDCTGRLICVFGCGGERDKGKRKLMGEVAGEIADEIILTNDNPRCEKPENIIDDILTGIREREIVQIILDRKEAISNALENTKDKDFVLIAGKGHEDYQEIRGIKYPFSDQCIIKELLGIDHD